ncbi:nucleotide-binding domain containing protein, partial [Francisella tularensis]|uniref:nucleotide-binding domain containing protein n=1 Tax=Francisella tularensis TaxID=263 RepID=UPI003877F8AE
PSAKRAASREKSASTAWLASVAPYCCWMAASACVEALFSLLAARLAEGGITRFIVAGGETSGVVTQSLGITGFHIGPCISPGVPWVNALHAPVSLALKSGNFGDESFFIRAQREFQV